MTGPIATSCIPDAHLNATYCSWGFQSTTQFDECIIPAGAYNAAELCCFWREEVCRAREDVLAFPRDKAGTCVLNKDGEPFRGTVEELSVAVNAGDVIFHEGRICGAWPKII